MESLLLSCLFSSARSPSVLQLSLALMIMSANTAGAETMPSIITIHANKTNLLDIIVLLQIKTNIIRFWPETKTFFVSNKH